MCVLDIDVTWHLRIWNLGSSINGLHKQFHAKLHFISVIFLLFLDAVHSNI